MQIVLSARSIFCTEVSIYLFVLPVDKNPSIVYS